jgi:FKBP-type peptidyl-prolyl cis-trans isomerase FklB
MTAAAVSAAAVVASAVALAQEPKPATPATAPATGGPDLKDVKSKVSYGFGLRIGREWKAQSVDLDPMIVAEGIKAGLSGDKPVLTDEDITKAMDAYRTELMAKQAEQQKKAGDTAKAAGEAYLTANKAKEGVKATASGLQYKVITEGKGAAPKATDVVNVHYEGTLIDGTVFDSSYARGEPAEFPVNGVIKGWVEGLQLMKTGAKYQFFIPADLAYGATPPRGSKIPPNAVLVFTVELLAVNGQK